MRRFNLKSDYKKDLLQKVFFIIENLAKRKIILSFRSF